MTRNARPPAGARNERKSGRRPTRNTVRPQPWLVCDPEELGDALNWMIQTAHLRTGPGEQRAPASGAELADRLGISRQQISKYVNGQDIPPADRWDAILGLLAIAGPDLGAWATACDRVRHHARRCKHRARDSTPIPAPPVPAAPYPDRPAGARHWPWLMLATALVVTILIVTADAYSGDRIGDRTPDSAAAAESAIDVQCLPLGSPTTWQNHHSRRYLSVAADLRDPSMVEPVARTTPPLIVAGPREAQFEANCATSFSALTGPGQPHRCLTAPGPGETSTVAMTECIGSPEQLWVLENHWPYENVMWQRIRPASDLGECLQEFPEGNGTVGAALRPCNSDWKQQWQITQGSAG